MRKDLKSAAEFIDKALLHMDKVVKCDNTPDDVRKRIIKVIDAFSIDRDELFRIKDYYSK